MIWGSGDVGSEELVIGRAKELKLNARSQKPEARSQKLEARS